MSRIRNLIAAAAAAIAALLLAGGIPAAAQEAAAAVQEVPSFAQDDGESVTYYVVQDKGDGEPEFLFEIAQRYLGDGGRYTEIFELNEGRRQADGSVVTTPEVLLPGWVLRMPEDAEGEGIRHGPLPDGVSAAGAAGTPSAGTPAGTPPATGETGALDDAVPYHVVGRTPEGEVEYLYLIAEELLGDGERWPEILELNQGRPQPDGGALTDPEVVHLGWVLQLPPDAEGEGVEHGPLPVPSAADPSPTAEDEGGSPAPGAETSTAGSPGAALAVAVGAGVLLVGAAAGVWFVLRRRRTARQEEPFDDSLLRTDTSSAWMVDRALRVLMAGCERDGVDVPDLAGVFVEGAVMRLRLHNPATPAPAPWVVSEDGASWSAQIGRLQTEPASSAPTGRYSRLVTVGVGESGRVLIDFAQARGIIGLDGPTRARHEVLRRWLGELTTNPWSADPRVVMVGNGLPQQEAAEHVAGIEQVTPELVLGEGGVLVLSRPPAVEQQEMLAARFADLRFGWVVIVLGAAPAARWRFTAGEDGWLRSGFLPDVRFDEQTAARRTKA
ncbi:hypothetical protein [Myceligenerans indicum]|uniref:LysM domain-containing protein n=1 Tax=Myceligenerans indicum TaxID=2593663 RepID=A0ABS1LK39_9MICO|nr:hypothetical protein [Myceligenerans indicum]MBL0886553.1 hypothetical protein [Myceligenerans indicum]